VLINLQAYKGSIRERVRYLLYGADGKSRNPSDVLVFGNVLSFLVSGELVSRKVKSFNYLVSFKEDYDSFEQKVGDVQAFVDELLSYLLPYEREDYEVLVVGHRDTDHFHLHITVLNRNLNTGKALYLPFNRSEVSFYQLLRRYFAAKYGLDLGQTRLVKHYVGDLTGDRESGRIRQMLAEALADYVRQGYADSRSELFEVLQDLGLEIVDVWESGVRVRKGEVELALVGGLFDEREFPRVKAELQQGELEPVSYFSSAEFRALSEELERVSEKRRAVVQRRVRKELEQAQRSRFKKDRKFCEPSVSSRAAKTSSIEASFPLTSSLSRLSFRRRGRLDGGSSQSASSEPISSRESLRSECSGVQWKQVVVPKILGLLERKEVGSGQERPVLRSSHPPTDTARTRRMIMKRMPFVAEDIDKAKRIDPFTLLRYYRLDYQQVGDQLRIRAPWREESEPSVFIRVNPATGHLIWKDFGGEQEGGSAIDFVMKASNVNFVEAVALLLELQGEPVLPEHPEKKLPSSFSRQSLPKGYTHRVLKVKDKVDHSALVSLLRRKGLDPNLLPPWVKELHWEVKRDDGYRGRFFGLAVKTVGGSWIVRTALDKRPKVVVQEEGATHSFAYCLASEGRRARNLMVVEGISDAIAMWQALARRGVAEDFDFVILGGTGNISKFSGSELLQNYDNVFLGLDLDEAGERAYGKMLRELESSSFKGRLFSLSRSQAESGKDINEIYRNVGRVKFERVYPEVKGRGSKRVGGGPEL
jgi:5S rRNA maturation endonuclease (ribonuclease M5)